MRDGGGREGWVAGRDEGSGGLHGAAVRTLDLRVYGLSNREM